MDKLLLSPDYTASNNDQTWETSAVETESSIITPQCLNGSPALNSSLGASPTTELSEFLIFNNRGNSHLAESEVLSDPELMFIPTPFQYDTPRVFPPIESPESDIFDLDIAPQLRNVIASANLGCKVDLRRIAMHAQNAEFNPRRSPALFMRIRNPYALAAIFSNGKILCTGSPSIQMSHRAARKFARIIQKLSFPVKFRSYKVENLIASCDFEFPFRLELLQHFTNCVYEPELFPGLVYRLANSRAKILIFASGRIILSGTKQKYELQKAFREIYPLLKLFEKKE